eukprot:194033-Rhodomonas_salina.1
MERSVSERCEGMVIEPEVHAEATSSFSCSNSSGCSLVLYKISPSNPIAALSLAASITSRSSDDSLLKLALDADTRKGG